MLCLSRLKEILIGWFFTHWHFDQSIKREDMGCPLRHRFARSHLNDVPIFFICSQEYIHSLHHDPSVTPVFYHYLYHHVSGHQPRIRRKMISTVWRQRRHYKKSVYQKKKVMSFQEYGPRLAYTKNFLSHIGKCITSFENFGSRPSNVEIFTKKIWSTKIAGWEYH